MAAENKKPLLSICVPTYNRGKILNICIERLLRAKKDNPINIIISDNGSTDETESVLLDYMQFDGVIINRNTSNLGFNGNVKKILSDLVDGDYCWIIGDDDYVNMDSIDIICRFINKYKPSYMAIGYKEVASSNLCDNNYASDKQVDYISGSYFKCIDSVSDGGNILGTLISTQIFKTERIKSIDFSFLGVNEWSDFKTVFPNSYMMTTQFHNDNNCIAITTPLISSVIHEKDWDDKLQKIFFEVIPSYYEYCKSMSSLDDLINNSNIVSSLLFSRSLHSLFHCDFKSIKWKYLFNCKEAQRYIKRFFFN